MEGNGEMKQCSRWLCEWNNLMLKGSHQLEISHFFLRSVCLVTGNTYHYWNQDKLKGTIFSPVCLLCIVSYAIPLYTQLASHFSPDPQRKLLTELNSSKEPKYLWRSCWKILYKHQQRSRKCFLSNNYCTFQDTSFKRRYSIQKWIYLFF